MATKERLVIKGKLFPLENISDNDYAADAYESTYFTSSTLMQLAQTDSVLAKSKSIWHCNRENLSGIAIILSQINNNM